MSEPGWTLLPTQWKDTADHLPQQISDRLHQGTMASICLLWKNLTLEIRTERGKSKQIFTTAFSVKKSLIPLMVRKSFKCTDQPTAWSLLLCSDKQLTNSPEIHLCFACSPLPSSRICNSIHTVQEQGRHKTSLCLTCHMEHDSHFLCFVIRHPHHGFSKHPLPVLLYP